MQLSYRLSQNLMPNMIKGTRSQWITYLAKANSVVKFINIQMIQYGQYSLQILQK